VAIMQAGIQYLGPVINSFGSACKGSGPSCALAGVRTFALAGAACKGLIAFAAGGLRFGLRVSIGLTCTVAAMWASLLI
jgi:hypothetical protein